MFVYQSRFLTRGEVWFDNEPDDTPVDWIYYRQRPNPVPKAKWKYFYTRLIDLGKSPAELLSEMEPKTAGKIKEALGNISCEWSQAQDTKFLDEVETMWNQLAAAQPLVALERVRLDQIAAAGALDISLAKDRAGTILTYHLSYVDKKRVQQMYIVSPYRSILEGGMRHRINCANCVLLWNTFLRMKERGLRYFDFGGWYPGRTDIRFLGMNAFKKGFGGEVVREYECEQILTLKGWLGLTVARFLHRVKGVNPSSPDTEGSNSHVDAETEQIKVSAAL